MGANLSQHQLARSAGLAISYPGRMERGRQEPTLSTLIALSEALGIHPTLLVSLTVGRLRREVQP
jgi:transcriptional regulator with XRE-family HTH domain